MSWPSIASLIAGEPPEGAPPCGGAPVPGGVTAGGKVAKLALLPALVALFVALLVLPAEVSTHDLQFLSTLVTLCHCRLLVF